MTDDGSSAGCVGVDGAGSGWVAAWRSEAGLALGWYADVATLMACHAQAHTVAVDMVIGLPERGRRQADALARRWIGAGRASSVYPAPLRAVLDATRQVEATARMRAMEGRGMSVQSFALLPKIRAWDSWLRAHPARAGTVYEVHPEASFRALCASGAALASKHLAEGRQQRETLLATALGPVCVQQALARRVSSRVAAADALDALAALWSAHRIACGTALRFPDPPERDALGLRMAIHV